MLVTIFTPTYNRAYRLPALYESLCGQTCKDFEWLIVDDGSSDNTEELVNEWIADDKITVRYIKQQNGGKHRAINCGLQVAKGEMFYIVDSDDVLPEDVIEFLVNSYIRIEDDNIAGISGCDKSLAGEVISNIPSESILSNSLDIRYKHNVKGDLAEVYKTKVLKLFPFPDFEGEKFCPEAVVFNRIAAKGYKILYVNKVLKLIEYLPDGLTAEIVKIRMNSPLASVTCYSELSRMNIPLIQKIKAGINYWRFRFCTHQKVSIKISPIFFILCPLGFILHAKDIR